MPELPEVETVAIGLRELLVGEEIKKVSVLRRESVAYPSNQKFCRSLVNKKVSGVRRRGKYLIIELSSSNLGIPEGGADEFLVVHLRMSGRLLMRENGASPDRFLRIKIDLLSGKELHFEDMRVFGRMWYVPPDTLIDDIVSGIGALGVEPLVELDGDYLKRRFAKKTQPVKNALLDQRIIAGIGNIYADESLFLSGVRPQREAGKLRPAELKRLALTIKSVLWDAIEKGGSTLRDYRKADGVNGNYQHSAWVYGRYREKCRNCSKMIERIKLGGRSTHFCPGCQK